MKWFLPVFLLLLLNGCSGLPKAMQDEPYTNVGLNSIQADFTTHKGKPLRWGGTIINVTNKENSSQAQLLYYPLNRFGRPRIGETEGRFMISRDQFLDPAVYKEGAEITVAGTLAGEIKQQVGKKTLTLPLLSIKYIHLWPERLRYYDEGYYPYYHPYYFHHSRYRRDYYYDWYY